MLWNQAQQQFTDRPRNPVRQYTAVTTDSYRELGGQSDIDRAYQMMREGGFDMNPKKKKGGKFNHLDEFRKYLEKGGGLTKYQYDNSVVDESDYDPEFSKAIDWMMNYEKKGDITSPGGYVGGGSDWGTNDPNYADRDKAKRYFYDNYWSMVKDLPPGLRTRALQLAVNTGDPYGEMLVAAGKMSVPKRMEAIREAEGKGLEGLEKAQYVFNKRKNESKKEIDTLPDIYETDPEKYFTALNKEQNRYYTEGLNNGKNPDKIKNFHVGYYEGIAPFVNDYYTVFTSPEGKITTSSPNRYEFENSSGERYEYLPLRQLQDWARDRGQDPEGISRKQLETSYKNWRNKQASDFENQSTSQPAATNTQAPANTNQPAPEVIQPVTRGPVTNSPSTSGIPLNLKQDPYYYNPSMGSQQTEFGTNNTFRSRPTYSTYGADPGSDMEAAPFMQSQMEQNRAAIDPYNAYLMQQRPNSQSPSQPAAASSTNASQPPVNTNQPAPSGTSSPVNVNMPGNNTVSTNPNLLGNYPNTGQYFNNNNFSREYNATMPPTVMSGQGYGYVDPNDKNYGYERNYNEKDGQYVDVHNFKTNKDKRVFESKNKNMYDAIVDARPRLADDSYIWNKDNSMALKNDSGSYAMNPNQKGIGKIDYSKIAGNPLPAPNTPGNDKINQEDYNAYTSGDYMGFDPFRYKNQKRASRHFDRGIEEGNFRGKGWKEYREAHSEPKNSNIFDRKILPKVDQYVGNLPSGGKLGVKFWDNKNIRKIKGTPDRPMPNIGWNTPGAAYMQGAMNSKLFGSSGLGMALSTLTGALDSNATLGESSPFKAKYRRDGSLRKVKGSSSDVNAFFNPNVGTTDNTTDNTTTANNTSTTSNTSGASTFSNNTSAPMGFGSSLFNDKKLTFDKDPATEQAMKDMKFYKQWGHFMKKYGGGYNYLPMAVMGGDDPFDAGNGSIEDLNKMNSSSPQDWNEYAIKENDPSRFDYDSALKAPEGDVKVKTTDSGWWQNKRKVKGWKA
jgi:hypothetical protein